VKEIMKKKIEYTDGSMSESEITIEMSTRTVDFFKNQAEKSNTQYQKMITNFLEEYVAQHQDK